ncbi:MAG: type II toxin-antitoxin system VapC family toxin [Desulfuromonadales bacterium]
MTPLVIDASIAVKWFIPESHSINAVRLLNADCELLAPDLIFAEFGNVLWKKWMRKELEPEVISPILADLIRMRLRIVPTEALADKAAAIAITYRRSFYDSIYLALAVTVQGRMVTADEKLCNALRDTSLAERLLWITAV